MPEITTAAVEASIDVDNDYLPGVDVSEGAVNKFTPANLLGTYLKQIRALADPGADKVLGWDDSAGTIDWFDQASGTLESLSATYSNDLSGAVTTIGATKKGLLVNAATTVTADLTVPRNIRLRQEPGGIITVNTGVTLTLNQVPEAGRYQIFNLVGTGKVVWNTQPYAYPQWWGAVDDCGDSRDAAPTGTDNTAFFQAALDAIHLSGGGTLDVRSGHATVSPQIGGGFLFTGATGLNISGYQNIQIVGNAGQDGYQRGNQNMVFSGTPTNCITAHSTHNFIMRNVGMQYTNMSFTGAMVYMGTSGGDPAYNLLENCSFMGRDWAWGGDSPFPSAKGVHFQNSIDCVVEKCSFAYVTTGISSSGYANLMAVRDCVFVYYTGYGIDLGAGSEAWSIQANNFEGGNQHPTLGDWLTKALKVTGSAWSIDFSFNWMGDGGEGLATDEPFVDVTGCYAFTAINNRFANYETTLQWGMRFNDCKALTLLSNRFEYLPSIQFTGSPVSGAVVMGNDYAAGTADYGNASYVTALSNGSDTAGNFVSYGLQVRGSGGTDFVGANINQIGFGQASGANPYVGQAGRSGGGIRMGSAFSTYVDGNMVFSTRDDTYAPFLFYNNILCAEMGSNGQKFALPQAMADNAYGAGWNGSLRLATENAVYDKIEALPDVLTGTLTVDPASIAATTVSSQTFTLAGALTTDAVQLNPPAAGLTAGLLVLQTFISAADTVTVVFQNTTGSAIDEASGTWRYILARA